MAQRVRYTELLSDSAIPSVALRDPLFLDILERFSHTGFWSLTFPVALDKKPTDQGKQDVKCSLMTGDDVLPLSLVVARREILTTSDWLLIRLTRYRRITRQETCSSSGYGLRHRMVEKVRRDDPHIQSRTEESDTSRNIAFKARR